MPTRRDRQWWKERWVADHYAQVNSPQMLKAHMEHAGYNCSSLARVAEHERIKNGSEKGVQRQMVSALVNGTVKRCEPDLAAAIERSLNVPEHMLFSVLPKSSAAGQTVKSSRSAA